MNPSPQGSRTSPGRPSASQRLGAFLSSAEFPCVGAKSALNKQRITFAEFDALGDESTAARLCEQLAEFSDAHPDPGTMPVSFVAMFHAPVGGELAFESALWALLQAMHEHDRPANGWDRSVGSDPSRNDFSFSVGGRAYFVVGLHPDASRQARRSPFPCVVFNFHNQFEAMKAIGKYQTMQGVIRDRDIELQGSINPMLARFGEASEARQYAGRAVDDAWQCPFRAKATDHA